MKKLSLIIAWFVLLGATPSLGYEYQLYKNGENLGIVVFPKADLPAELDQYIKSLSLNPVESGKAVMRSGSKGENETFMMPFEVQKKHSIEKFMVVQVLTPSTMMIGVFDPEWGLTLPSSIFGLDEMKKNIPKTLDVFRGNNKRKEILWKGKSNLDRNLRTSLKIGFGHERPLCHKGQRVAWIENIELLEVPLKPRWTPISGR